MRPTTVVIPMALAALVLTACAGTPGPAPGGQTTASSPSQVRLVAEQDANLHLWVSNQSFEDPVVEIRVSIDGVEVVARQFEVLSQHNWILFPVSATPGTHVLDVVAETHTKMSQTFTLPAAGRQYAVVNYWNYPSDGGRKFSWHIQSTPVGFD